MEKLVYPHSNRQRKKITLSMGLLLQDPRITNNLSALPAIQPQLTSHLFQASSADT